MDERNQIPAPEQTPRSRAAVIAAWILTILFVAACAAFCIFIYPSVVRIALAAVCIFLLILTIRSENPGRRLVDLIALFLVGCFVMFGFTPIILESHLKWQYPFQKAYAALRHNCMEPDWFPQDFMADVVSDYELNNVPSIMQGIGYYSVEFVTTPEKAAGYASRYAEQAVYTVPLSDYSGSSFYYLDEKQEQVLDVYVGHIWNTDHSVEVNTTIYVLYTNGNWNHPHSSAVLVDPTTGRVQFSQLG